MWLHFGFGVGVGVGVSVGLDVGLITDAEADGFADAGAATDVDTEVVEIFNGSETGSGIGVVVRTQQAPQQLIIRRLTQTRFAS